MIRLTLLRHGESLWNRERRFAGWSDVGLSPAGTEQAVRAGRLLAASGAVFDVCHTSCLQRAADTARIALASMGASGLTVERSWRLNERHYGALQGLGVAEAVRRFGFVRVLRCRYGFRTRPPALAPAEARLAARDPRYQSIAPNELPTGESIADTLERMRVFWEAVLAPALVCGERVFVVSHHHTLRALLRLVTPGKVPVMRIGTGVPILVDLDGRLQLVRHHRLAGEAAA